MQMTNLGLRKAEPYKSLKVYTFNNPNCPVAVKAQNHQNGFFAGKQNKPIMSRYKRIHNSPGRKAKATIIILRVQKYIKNIEYSKLLEKQGAIEIGTCWFCQQYVDLMSKAMYRALGCLTCRGVSIT